MMTEETKTIIDYTSGGITVGAFFDALPEVTALIALCWYVVRLWETDTIQKIAKRITKAIK